MISPTQTHIPTCHFCDNKRKWESQWQMEPATPNNKDSHFIRWHHHSSLTDLLWQGAHHRCSPSQKRRREKVIQWHKVKAGDEVGSKASSPSLRCVLCIPANGHSCLFKATFYSSKCWWNNFFLFILLWKQKFVNVKSFEKGKNLGLFASTRPLERSIRKTESVDSQMRGKKTIQRCTKWLSFHLILLHFMQTQG